MRKYFVFKNNLTKRIARKGLKKARLIYLRDKSGSETALRSIGISGEHIKSTFDDALFFHA